MTGKKPKMSRDKILKLFLHNHVSVSALASMNGVSFDTMRRWLIEWLGEEEYKKAIRRFKP